MKTKNILFAIGLIAISSAANAVEDEKEHAKKEKCYGVVKAGKNDCSAADGSHSCAGYAKIDASGKDWVLLPEGTCERIIGGSTKPILENKS
jgi:uncharacterized membrane protein